MTPYTKTIVCLAKSWKSGGSCVAGLEVDGDQLADWIRPVSDREHRELSFSDMRFDDWTTPALLDLLEIRFLRKFPEHHQRENHLIDNTHTWRRVGRQSADRLLAARQNPHAIWLNGSSSSHGINDRVSAEDADRELDSSLLLIEPQGPQIELENEYDASREEERLRKRVAFHYSGQPYRLALTDPVAAGFYRVEGNYPIEGRTLLCISLGEALGEYCYKLVAGVIKIE